VARIVVVPDYFESLDLAIRRGRGFAGPDGAAGAEAVIVNEVFAARYFPDVDPLGGFSNVTALGAAGPASVKTTGRWPSGEAM
jgi:hypothetical protein